MGSSYSGGRVSVNAWFDFIGGMSWSFWHLRGCLADRLENSWVIATAAQMALHAGKHFRIGRLGMLLEQADDAQNHSGCAIATLEGPIVKERFLDRMKLVTFGQAFNGQNSLLMRIADRSDAGGDALAAEQDGAGAALAFPAAVFCAGQMEGFAQNRSEEHT